MTKAAVPFLLLTFASLFALPIAANADYASAAERTDSEAGAHCSFQDDHYTRELVRLRVVETSQEQTIGPGYVYTSTTYLLAPAGCGEPDDTPER